MKKRIITLSAITVVLFVVILTLIFFRSDDTNDRQKVSDNPKDYQFITIQGGDKNFEFSLGKENIASVSYTQGSNDKEDEEYHLDVDTAEKIQKLLCDYCKVIAKDEEKYWPHTDEYPDMLVLWRVEFTNEEATFWYRSSGALCYPKNWEGFIAELESYLK